LAVALTIAVEFQSFILVSYNMLRFKTSAGHFFAILFVCLTSGLAAQEDEKAWLAKYREAAMESGDAGRGKKVFESKEAACTKCHVISGDERKAGPNLFVIGDKYSREQMIRAVLEPNAMIHPDYGTIKVLTTAGKVITGVLRKRTDKELQLLDAEGKLVRIASAEIDEEQRSKSSLMPAELFKAVKTEPFGDLIAYLMTLKQKDSEVRHPSLAEEIPAVEKPIRLEPLHSKEMRFDHPVWIIAIPKTKSEFLVVEQKTRRVWRLEKGNGQDRKELFVDLSKEATTGQFEGVMCLAFHPQFRENRKYYINHHVRNQGSHFSPVIIERQATKDLKRDAGVSSRRLLQIPQDTDLHWGGMLAFGPDGYLYIGAGDAGPQEDPEGHGQDMSLLIGKILRIDVDQRTGDLPYAIPESNPYRDAGSNVRPEIFASGFRMPWRFSWDPVTGDMWVGEIGQNLFEEVSIVRLGENHGWNVYEAFTEFSDRYRRAGEQYTPPVISYRRKQGVSVTGGYVYRGKKSPSYYGAYIFSDFESKRIWAATQTDRKLLKIRQIGTSPEQPASFGVDSDGELFLVGYQGTIFRVVLDDSVFE
jgi:putative heme-binding domain-containing protein